MNKVFKDPIGKRFGRLVIVELIKLSYNKQGQIQHRYYNCKCDCGNNTLVTWSNLNRKGRSTKSCGCLYKESRKTINKLANSQASFNAVYSSYKSNAKERGYIFNLTKEEFKEITQLSCTYCGDPPSNIRTAHLKHRIDHFKYNGIDRVDNNIGYLKSNCVPCCKHCNSLKLNRTTEELKEHVIKLYNNLDKY